MRVQVGDVLLLKDGRFGYLRDRADPRFPKILLYILETHGYEIVSVDGVGEVLGNRKITRSFTGPIGKSEEEKILECLLEYQRRVKDNEVGKCRQAQVA